MSGANVGFVVALAAGTTVVRDAVHGKPSIKPVVGGFMLGAGLLMVNMFNPAVATGLATLIFVTALILNGAEIFQVANKAVGG